MIKRVFGTLFLIRPLVELMYYDSGVTFSSTVTKRRERLRKNVWRGLPARNFREIANATIPGSAT